MTLKLEVLCLTSCLACYPARPRFLYSDLENTIYKPLAWGRLALHVDNAEGEDLPLTKILRIKDLGSPWFSLNQDQSPEQATGMSPLAEGSK